jgi:hypothetical protein
MQRLFLIGISILFIAGTGCSKTGSTTSSAAENAMGNYAGGYNELVDEIEDRIIDNYFDDIPEAGPGKMTGRLLSFPQHNFVGNEITKARQAFAEAAAAAPASMAHIAPLATELLAAAEKVTVLYGESHLYYKAENFKDDGGARGKELHAAMLSEVKRFRNAVHAFNASIDGIEDEQMAAAVKEHERDKGYGYWFRKMTFDAKKFLSAVQGAEILADTETALTLVETTAGQFGEFVISMGGKDKVIAAFKGYVTATDDYMTVVARLRRLLKSDEPDMDKIGEEADKLVDAYNLMITIGNSLYELEEYNLLK